MWSLSDHSISQSVESRGYLHGNYLASGAHGHCYTIRRVADGTLFVLKLSEVSHDDVAHAMREIEVMLTVPPHPHVVGLVEHWLVALAHCGVMCIVMELCDSGDLGQYLDKFYPKEQVLFRWTRQLLSALVHLHQHQVVHRDVKPQNIFLCNCGLDIKLGDFGVSRILLSTKHATSTVGTPQYMAPEVFDGAESGGHTAKADVWSVGTVLYLAVSGRNAFRGANLGRLMFSVLSGRFTPLWELPGVRSRYTQGFLRMIHSMLVHDPRTRPSCDILLQDMVRKKATTRVMAVSHTEEYPMPWLSEVQCRDKIASEEAQQWVELFMEVLARDQIQNLERFTFRGFLWGFLRELYTHQKNQQQNLCSDHPGGFMGEDPMAVLTATLVRTCREDATAIAENVADDEDVKLVASFPKVREGLGRVPEKEQSTSYFVDIAGCSVTTNIDYYVEEDEQSSEREIG